MSEGELLNKIQNRFMHFPGTEESVVFLLSRIRKILEINHKPKQYTILNFYCNLALHSEIDKIPPKVKEKLVKIKDGSDYSNSIVGFKDFHKQLREFLQEFNLPDFYEMRKEGDIRHFNELLTSIYSDTPIYFISEHRYKIVIDSDGGISGSSEDVSD